jgi:hypothetical protein
MAIPPSITAGVDVVWTDAATTDLFGNAVTSATHNLTYYFRLNTAGEGVTAAGTAYADGWQVTIPAATSAAMDASTGWYFQAVLTAISGGAVSEYSRGQIEVQASLAYSGTPGAFDGRSQTQKDLEAVQAAIRSLMAGGATQEYRIGNRSLKRYDLADLLALESRLKAQVARENKAKIIDSGLGDPNNLFIRFGNG